jgi:3'-phosphoadenosine 5'-phosphosulfate (PAPS) 3'-phosphatase
VHAEATVGLCFWLVDPLDGTREFINCNGEFTVNIALIENGEPVLGVVFAPALQRLFAGARDCVAFIEQAGKREVIQCRTVSEGGLAVVASRSSTAQGALTEKRGLIVEDLPVGCGRSGPISSSEPNHGVGYRSRSCGIGRRRGADFHTGW